jgi:hypothetical protein
MPGFFIFEDQRLIPNHLRQLQKNRHEGAEMVETAKMKLLLICGILAPVLYFCTDILGGMLGRATASSIKLSVSCLP